MKLVFLLLSTLITACTSAPKQESEPKKEVALAAIDVGMNRGAFKQQEEVLRQMERTDVVQTPTGPRTVAFNLHLPLYYRSELPEDPSKLSAKNGNICFFGGYTRTSTSDTQVASWNLEVRVDGVLTESQGEWKPLYEFEPRLRRTVPSELTATIDLCTLKKFDDVRLVELRAIDSKREVVHTWLWTKPWPKLEE